MQLSKDLHRSQTPRLFRSRLASFIQVNFFKSLQIPILISNFSNDSIELIEIVVVIVAEIVGIENYQMPRWCRRGKCTFLDTRICISSSFVIPLLEQFILMDVLLNLSTI